MSISHPSQGKNNSTKLLTSVTHVYTELCAQVLTVTQACPTLCNPMDCSPPDSFVHGILQARIQEWVAISSSRGSSQRKAQTCAPVTPALSEFLATEPHGKPQFSLQQPLYVFRMEVLSLT